MMELHMFPDADIGVILFYDRQLSAAEIKATL